MHEEQPQLAAAVTPATGIYFFTVPFQVNIYINVTTNNFIPPQGPIPPDEMSPQGTPPDEMSLQGPTPPDEMSPQGTPPNEMSLQGPTPPNEMSLQGPTPPNEMSLQGPTLPDEMSLQGPTLPDEIPPQDQEPSSNEARICFDMEKTAKNQVI